MGKQIILFGAGFYGERAMNFFGIGNVFCFVDNQRAGYRYCNKDVISFETLLNIHNGYDVIISVNAANSMEISEQLTKHGIFHATYNDYVSEYINQQDSLNVKKIKKYSNLYQGQKIFLIGNGPSLTTQDLELIQKNNIKSMACNFINKIFDKTSWRPDFYCCAEMSAIVLNKDFIQNFPSIVKFVRITEDPLYYNTFGDKMIPDNLCFFNSGGVGTFSNDVSLLVNGGYSVMYEMLQFALYLGFSEIYLLGVDNTQPPAVHTTNFIDSKPHFYEESNEDLEQRIKIMKHHDDDDDWELYQERTCFHYNLAKKRAEEQGTKIYNATRGGKLEVFNRVDFDSLF